MTLVAGATGFVSFALVARLTQEGIEKRARVSIRRRPSRRVCGARGTVYTPVSAGEFPACAAGGPRTWCRCRYGPCNAVAICFNANATI